MAKGQQNQQWAPPQMNQPQNPGPTTASMGSFPQMTGFGPKQAVQAYRSLAQGGSPDFAAQGGWSPQQLTGRLQDQFQGARDQLKGQFQDARNQWQTGMADARSQFRDAAAQFAPAQEAFNPSTLAITAASGPSSTQTSPVARTPQGITPPSAAASSAAANPVGQSGPAQEGATPRGPRSGMQQLLSRALRARDEQRS